MSLLIFVHYIVSRPLAPAPWLCGGVLDRTLGSVTVIIGPGAGGCAGYSPAPSFVWLRICRSWMIRSGCDTGINSPLVVRDGSLVCRCAMMRSFTG